MQKTFYKLKIYKGQLNKDFKRQKNSKKINKLQEAKGRFCVNWKDYRIFEFDPLLYEK